MMLFMLLPVALVIAAVWLLATAADRDRRPAGDEAGAILRQRLAAGDIDVEQYEQARAALGIPSADRSRP